MRRDFYRRFAPLFVCQFTNAFSDNLFRSAFAAALTVGAGGASGDYATVVAAAPGVFILPFFLFSAVAGEIADKSDKTKMLRIVKCAEIVVVLLSLWAWRASSPSALLAAIFLFGAQSAFFGPLKYSLLAEQARADELLLGNALFTSSTFAAILLGWIGGAWLGAETNGGLLALAAPLCVFSLAGVVGAFLNPHANPDFRDRAPLDWRAPWRGFAAALRAVKNDLFLRRAVLALSWFWLLGALLLTELPIAAGEMQIGRGGYLALLASLCAGAGHGRVFLPSIFRRSNRCFARADGAFGRRVLPAFFVGGADGAGDRSVLRRARILGLERGGFRDGGGGGVFRFADLRRFPTRCPRRELRTRDRRS